jgi:CDGSH-type Zn-finger protein
VLRRGFAELQVLEKRKNFTIYKMPNHVNKAKIMELKEYKEAPEPLIRSFTPYVMENPRISDKKYYWCSCGLSRKQPFCDSSHIPTAFKPVVFQVEERVKEVYLCLCKHTTSPPYCDGKACKEHQVVSESHNTRS